MNTANETILSTIKDLRHLLVVQCQRLREAGTESDDLNLICNATVTMERLMAMIKDSDDANT